MPVYDFTFPASAAGAVVRVRDAAGSLVNTGVVSVADGDSAFYSVALGTGSYDASVQPAVNVADVAGVAAAGGGSGDDTAYLIATGVEGASDLSTIHVPLELDDRYGAAPSWLTINGSGDIELGLDAGGIFFTGLDVSTADYTATTPCDGTIQGGITAKVNGNQVTTGNISETTGDGQDIQENRALAVDQTGFGTLAFYVELGAYDSEAASIPDGVVTHDVYVVLKKVIDVADEIA